MRRFRSELTATSALSTALASDPHVEPNTERRPGVVFPHPDASSKGIDTNRFWSSVGASRQERISRTERIVIPGLLAVGIIAGVVAKVADESQARWLADLGTYPAIWVLVLALSAWTAPSPKRAAIRAMTFFTAACLAYYGWASLIMDFTIDRNVLLWTGLAVTIAPVIAASTRWSRDQDAALQGVVLASIAALALSDGIVWQLWWAWSSTGMPEGFPLHPIQAIVNVAVALTVAALLPWRWNARACALLLLIPCAIIVSRLVDVVMGTLLRFL